jgi:hypothetical protein
VDEVAKPIAADDGAAWSGLVGKDAHRDQVVLLTENDEMGKQYANLCARIWPQDSMGISGHTNMTSNPWRRTLQE